jgi:hypothetical protein
MKRTTLAVIFGITLVLAGTVVAILFARGYNFDISKKELSSTGILVATSDPDGAMVSIASLRAATNSTMNMTPGIYKVKIQKDGFTPWEKSVEIKKEEVIKTNVFLFPALSDLRPLTFTGAKNPIISTDNTKIAYGVASASSQLSLNQNGIWIIDMGRIFVPTPIFSAADFRQIYRNTTTLSLSDTKFSWSPDNKQILAGNYLLDTDRLDDTPTFIASPSGIIAEWKILLDARKTAQNSKLPVNIKQILATNSGELTFSPDETKVLYTATASAVLPIAITNYLPGKNPTPEVRTIKPGNTYVYDLKEDRNYWILVSSDQIRWFPSSRHLISTADNQISIMEFDGTNKAVVFNGAFKKDAVFAWPNWSKLVILTSLGSTTGTENLYTVNFR